MLNGNEAPKAKQAAQALAKMGGSQPELEAIPRRRLDYELSTEAPSHS